MQHIKLYPVWSSNSKALGILEITLIAITLYFNLTRNISTCMGPTDALKIYLKIIRIR